MTLEPGQQFKDKARTYTILAVTIDKGRAVPGNTMPVIYVVTVSDREGTRTLSADIVEAGLSSGHAELVTP